MARSIWKGSITFGLVNIPVGLYSAEQREDVSFHQLDKRDMSRIRYKRVSESTGKETPWDNIVRGYEYEPGKYVVLSDEDLKRASPEKTQTVDILDFVDLEEIDPRFFDKPYYLAPDKRGAKSYALLRETLRRTRKVGIATVVIRSKQYLAAVTVHDDVIVLNILRYGNELRDTDDLDLPKGDEGVSERELDMAERLVEGMVSEWDPERYHDTYQEDLKAMIERRVKAGQTEAGAEPAEEAPKPARGQVVDLMALLKRSVEESGPSGGGGKTAAKKSAAKAPAKKPAPAKKSAPAKKTAAKKTASSSASRKKSA
ncbi:MAG TPA: Ku protein [Thermoanaerobaculia bacterium]|nr:Ku protein [Thermoanaerobaculia bacterium]